MILSNIMVCSVSVKHAALHKHGSGLVHVYDLSFAAKLLFYVKAIMSGLGNSVLMN